MKKGNIIAVLCLYSVLFAHGSPEPRPGHQKRILEMQQQAFTLALSACPLARTADKQRPPEILSQFRLASDTPGLGAKEDWIDIVGFYTLDRRAVVTVVMVNRAKKITKVIFDHTAPPNKASEDIGARAPNPQR